MDKRKNRVSISLATVTAAEPTNRVEAHPRLQALASVSMTLKETVTFCALYAVPPPVSAPKTLNQLLLLIIPTRHRRSVRTALRRAFAQFGRIGKRAAEPAKTKAGTTGFYFTLKKLRGQWQLTIFSGQANEADKSYPKPVTPMAAELPTGTEPKAVITEDSLFSQLEHHAQFGIYQRAAEHSPEAIFWIREDTSFYYVNETACKELQYSREEFNHLLITDINPVFDKDAYTRDWDTIPKEVFFGMEGIHRRKDGSTFPVAVWFSFVVFQGKQYSCAYCKNITEQKQQIEAIKTNEERFRQILTYSKDGIVIADLSGNLLDANESFLEMLGYTAEELRLLSLPDVHPVEAVAEAKRQFAAMAAGRLRISSELPFKRKDGSVGYVTINSFPIAWGDAQALAGVFHETTALVIAREQLTRSEERFRIAVESVDEGLFAFDVPANTVWLSPAYQRIFSLPSYKSMVTPDELLAYLHPDDAAALSALISDCITTNNDSYTIEYRLLLPGEKIKWIEGRGRVTRRDAEGTALLINGVITDITDKKEAFLQLEKERAQLQTLLNTLPDPVWLRGPAEDIVLGNVAFTELFNTSPNIFSMANEPTLVHPRKNATATAWEPWPGFTKKQLIERVRADIYGSNGTVLGTLGIARNVTSLFESQWELSERIKELRCIFNISTILNNSTLSLPELLQTLVSEIPPAFQSPQFTFAQITYEHITVSSGTAPHDGVRKTADITTPISSGCITVTLASVNQEEQPLNFLKEEVDLLYEIARRTGEALTKRIVEEQYVESERRLSTLMANLPGMAYRCKNDKNWTMEFVSEGCFELTGYHADELLQNQAVSYNDLILPEDRDAVWSQVEEAVYHKQQFELVYQIRKKDGTVHWVWERGRGFFNGATLICLEGFITDVSKRIEAEAELQQINMQLDERIQARTAELEAANRELESFAYSVSHDLRAPLRAIDGFSRALEEDYAALFDANAHDLFRRIRGGAERMGRLIEDLLRLSRIMRTNLHLQVVNISELAEKICTGLQAAMPGKTFSWHIEAGLVATADPGLLESALENLLGNAFKFSALCPAPVITVGQKLLHDEPVYYISDNGAGFDMRYYEKLFGVFQRLHDHNEFPGTGVGLATVQRIITRHGGRIWAQAQTGKGATFYFTLRQP